MSWKLKVAVGIIAVMLVSAMAFSLFVTFSYNLMIGIIALGAYIAVAVVFHLLNSDLNDRYR